MLLFFKKVLSKNVKATHKAHSLTAWIVPIFKSAFLYFFFLIATAFWGY